MSTRTDVDTFVQELQRFHSTLTPTQQRMLETILETAQRGTTTTGTTGTTPDVTGYMATGGTRWTTLGNWLTTTTTGTTGRTTTPTTGTTRTPTTGTP